MSRSSLNFILCHDRSQLEFPLDTNNYHRSCFDINTINAFLYFFNFVSLDFYERVIVYYPISDHLSSFSRGR
jgi:hypothetical protein